ncbi:MAG: helix-turn-helix domain-containing protein [Terrisporobacter sp.]
MNLPIVTIDYTTSYGDIMNSIMSLILEKQKFTILEMKISALLDNNLSLSDIHATLNYINYYFSKYVTAIYCTSDNFDYKFDTNLINLISKSKFTSCIPFKKGLLILITYNNIDKSELQKTIEFYTNLLEINVNDYIIGVSDNFIPITSCKNAINQALLSCKFNTVTNKSIIHYTSLGIYSLIINFKDFDELKELYYSIISPIKNYDKENNAYLLETLISFINNDGDFKKVSKELFQHENTVRYRILKIRSLLNLEKSHIEFFEKISIGVKLHKIYNN